MKTKKIRVPENHADITLSQFIKYTELKKREGLTQREFDKRKLMIFTDISYKQVEGIEVADYIDLIQWIDKAVETDAEFKPTFKIGDTEYGFIPNFDEIQAKEYFDLKTYKDEDENLHKIMAILFRPVTSKDAFGNYEIAEYNGTEGHAEQMKQMSMAHVFGAVFFFRNLRTELSNFILQYTELEHRKAEGQKPSLKSGVGIRQFMQWLKGSRGSLST